MGTFEIWMNSDAISNLWCVVGDVVGKVSSHRASELQFLGSRREVGSMWVNVGRHGNLGSRQFWILPPAQMGRRSAKIATKKVAHLSLLFILSLKTRELS